MYRKQGGVVRKEYVVAVQVCKDEIRKAKAHMKLNMMRDMKNTRRNSSPDKREGKTVINRHRNAEVLNKFFTSVFTASQTSHFCHVPKSRSERWGKKISLTVREKQI